MHADEINVAATEELGKEVYHYHLHAMVLPVVEKEILWSKRCKNPELRGTVKEVVNQISHSKKWKSDIPMTDEKGNPLLKKNGKPMFRASYSILQDELFNYMTERGFKGFQRGEYGSTAEHLTSLQYQIQQDKERLEKLQKRIQKEQVKYEPARHISKTLNEIDGMGQKTFTGKMAISKEDYSQLTALAKEGITSRAEINKLEQSAIPREQIAFIHEANTEVRKKELFAKVRSGQVRVLMGSTFKMGAGMNVQDRLVALHDLDCPWRPGDLEQRSGRIIRQGNRNKEVHIYRYVTESTFDAYLWQTVENKQKFISQIMTSKSPVRSCEDIDEAALSYAEIKALCAGDERIREKMDLDVDVARLRLMKANHQSQQYRLEDNILRHFPAQIEENKGFLSGFEADMKTLEAHPHPKDGFAGMEVKGDFLTDKDNAGAAILEAFKDAKGLEPVPIGSYRGFAMSLTVENFGKDFILTLKGKMSHRVELGKDARGNLVRIDNALAQMPERYKTVQGRLENVQAQLATAKAELGKPFPQEAELKEKSARLAELNAELNIDDRTPMEQAAENVVAKRPSVLDKLKAPCVHGAGEKKKSHEQEAR